MKIASPLRYPGGKASLTAFLTDVIELNDLRGRSYYEPYAGGAGAALSLLRNNVVSNIYINDADQRVYAFWNAALKESARFVDAIFDVPLTISEWHNQKEICNSPGAYDQFSVGFAAFYMNRCNRSGVLTGAGPIGGYEQSGKWTLDVRFNRETLAERILAMAKVNDRIMLTNMDAIDFLKEKLPRGKFRSKVFVYFDPPYVNKGQRLYLNSYLSRDHKAVSKYIASQKALNWLLSYDDTDLVRELYSGFNLFNLPVRYSLQQKKLMQELIIAPNHLKLPTMATVSGAESMISRCDLEANV
ncbi:DNA adenine methylase [Pseudomonas sp. TE50-2]|uniref:DNA adenine methylase n=1 Tax=Pseudomonas sp. TE50-2 TaxID=3142707 RepID=UPI00346775B8